MKRRLVIAVIAVSSLLPVPARPASAAEGSVYGGACVMTLAASFSPGLTTNATQQSVGLNGTGTCQVNISLLASGAFAAGTSTTSVGMSCSAGVSTGLGDFTLTGTPSLPSATNGTVAIINLGGTFVVAFSWQVYRFVAVGAFAQIDTRGALCPTGAQQTGASLAGAFALEDPTLPFE